MPPVVGGHPLLATVYTAHKRLYHSTLGLIVIKKKKSGGEVPWVDGPGSGWPSTVGHPQTFVSRNSRLESNQEEVWREGTLGAPR